MTAPLSNDLRIRVVRAIEGGLSRRAAAARFDISIASAVRRHQRYRRDLARCAGCDWQGRHSHRAEAHAARVPGWINEKSDITLVEIAARLAAEGHVFAPATIWQLLDRHDYTVKKDHSCRRTGSLRRKGSPLGFLLAQFSTRKSRAPFAEIALYAEVIVQMKDHFLLK